MEKVPLKNLLLLELLLRDYKQSPSLFNLTAMSFPESIFPFPIFPPDHLRPSENMFTVKREADGAATPRWYRKYQIHISQR